GSGYVPIYTIAFDSAGQISPTITFAEPGRTAGIGALSAARTSLPSVAGDGLNIDLFEGIGSGVPSPDRYVGVTPNISFQSPFIEFPNPTVGGPSSIQAYSVEGGPGPFKNFFANTTTPPSQIANLYSGSFTLRQTFYLAVSQDMNQNPSAPGITIQLGVGSDDGFWLKVGQLFINDASDRGFGYTWST